LDHAAAVLHNQHGLQEIKVVVLASIQMELILANPFSILQVDQEHSLMHGQTQLAKLTTPTVMSIGQRQY